MTATRIACATWDTLLLLAFEPLPSRSRLPPVASRPSPVCYGRSVARGEGGVGGWCMWDCSGSSLEVGGRLPCEPLGAWCLVHALLHFCTIFAVLPKGLAKRLAMPVPRACA
eukprot:scaffold156682_cov30-Tisochrysis_lutea.AAC.1